MPVSHGRYRSSELEDRDLEEQRRRLFDNVRRAANTIAKKHLDGVGNYIVVSPGIAEEFAEEINRLTRKICQ